MKCTWQDCEAEAKHPQIAKDGEQWAHLCDAHHNELRDSIEPGRSIPKMVSNWIKAQGGSKAAARRMRP